MAPIRDVLLAPLLEYMHSVKVATGESVKIVLEVDAKTLLALAAGLDHGLPFEGPLIVSGGSIIVRERGTS